MRPQSKPRVKLRNSQAVNSQGKNKQGIAINKKDNKYQAQVSAKELHEFWYEYYDAR